MSVTINEKAYAKIMLHATRNSRSCVHGILIGSSSSEITDALPVSHSIPTKPIIDMALQFADAYCEEFNSNSEGKSIGIVGWYVGNELEDDDEPNPVTKKIVSGIEEGMTDGENENDIASPTSAALIMINKDYKYFMKKQCGSDGSKKGFDIFFGGEKKPINSVNIQGNDWVSISEKIVDMCHKGYIQVYDFEDQIDGGVSGFQERDWLRNPQVI